MLAITSRSSRTVAKRRRLKRPAEMAAAVPKPASCSGGTWSGCGPGPAWRSMSSRRMGISSIAASACRTWRIPRMNRCDGSPASASRRTMMHSCSSSPAATRISRVPLGLGARRPGLADPPRRSARGHGRWRARGLPADPPAPMAGQLAGQRARGPGPSPRRPRAPPSHPARRDRDSADAESILACRVAAGPKRRLPAFCHRPLRDLTFDSRVQREARTLSRNRNDVTVYSSPPPSLTRRIASSPAGRVAGNDPAHRPAPSSKAESSGRVARVPAKVGRFVATRGRSRSSGRSAVSTAGSVDVWHAHGPDWPAGSGTPVRPPTRLVYDSHEIFMETGSAARLPNPLRRLLAA